MDRAVDAMIASVGAADVVASYAGPADAMRLLAADTARIARFIPPGARVGFVDYPMHINVGDLLIFLGAMDFFAANRNPLPVSFCLYDAGERAFAALEDVDVIACHGGGNFGDIYPRHQRLREAIVRRFPHKPVVIMPQSIQFGSEQAMAESAAVFRRHPDVAICVRDAHSEAVARHRFTDKVLLLPDMAHRLYDAFAPVRDAGYAPEDRPFHLLRRDVEAAGTGRDAPQGADWNTIMRFSEKLRMERHRSAARLRGRLGLVSASAVHAYRDTVDGIVTAIAGRLAARNPWTTSRLHGAIFGLLLGRQVTLKDNSYGKNSRYFDQWNRHGRLSLS